MLAAFLMAAIQIGFAQVSSKVEKTVNEMVKKYENVKGVECITLVKGSGLELMKTVFNKEFGRSFMKGVTSITIIEYGDAPEQTCQQLRKELDVFTSLLQDFNLGKEKEFSDNDYVRAFANEKDGKLSDFIIAIEDGSSKTIMYMAGEIIVD